MSYSILHKVGIKYPQTSTYVGLLRYLPQFIMEIEDQEVNSMGGLINWLAYVWLITSEMAEELFYMTIGDSFRRFISSVELREQAPRMERKTLTRQKATDTV